MVHKHVFQIACLIKCGCTQKYNCTILTLYTFKCTKVQAYQTKERQSRGYSQRPKTADIVRQTERLRNIKESTVNDIWRYKDTAEQTQEPSLTSLKSKRKTVCGILL